MERRLRKAQFTFVTDTENPTISQPEVYERLSWLFQHHVSMNEGEAELRTAPVTSSEAARLADTYGTISGYVLLDVDELLIERDMEAFLRELLVGELHVTDLEWEIVWGYSRTLMIFVCCNYE